MYEEKQAVLKITTSKSLKGLKAEIRKVLGTKDSYKIAGNPFLKFIYDEINNIRGVKIEEYKNK